MLQTKLTERLNIDHPVISAPMAFAAGGKLAASISKAGGLGLIGGAYGDRDWIESQFLEAGNQPVGCGFITWALKEKPELLNEILAHNPKAVFLSFGDPAPFVNQIKASRAQLICQVQTLKDAIHAIECGADIIVAQGSEAGGHGQKRGTFTLVPEIANWISIHNSDALLCAAGGIGNGRGLAASLMLGADGVLVGSRFWASSEALVHPKMIEAAIESTGDETIRSSVMDIAREISWPQRYSCRVLKNDFTDKWHENIEGLRAEGKVEADRWRAAWAKGDVKNSNTFVGEVTGLIDDIKPAADILKQMVSEASTLIKTVETENIKR